ncbi:glycosyl transferase, family 2 [Roseobacter sp. AzwK-3b]|uniref:glycosyltransferase family 2 protein n=1 Tax=Roseobacter sp. AzwK-3b TaxID=351016 RepID=UPI00015697DC|nr:glycosyltransferase [Roseobacter sp. AzwK-3b]EDM72739.1 glycosyl transferase, family 2 [Roseobacter sp. AzwK-3b]
MIAGLTIGLVIIGRNEGARLIRALASVPDGVDRIVYVDSGSTDGSVDAARAAGAEVVTLDMTQPFTAARARNSGVDRLLQAGLPDAIQFMDGDCELRDGWIAHAAAFLVENPKAAVACGRRRERFPEASVYNRLCDAEWNTPVGRAKACGGDALMRAEAFEAVGGFNPSLIAGEEPELCVRLRAAGWEVWRLDHEMTWHDAAMMRLSQWWTRTRRGGYAFALGASLHGAPPERHWVRETRRALIWGAVLPSVLFLAAVLITPWALLGMVLYPLQIVRIALKSGPPFDWPQAFFMVLGKFAEALGVVQCWLDLTTGRRKALIEYK